MEVMAEVTEVDRFVKNFFFFPKCGPGSLLLESQEVWLVKMQVPGVYSKPILITTSVGRNLHFKQES